MCADNGWDEGDANVVCQQLSFSDQRALPTIDSRFGDGEGPILLENVNCSEGQSTLSQCVNSMFTGALHHCKHTAGVICMGEFMTSTRTEQIPRTVYVTTTNMSHDSTYKSHDTTSIASDSSVIAIVGTVGALFIMTVIAVIAMVLIAMLRLRKTKANR